MHRMLLPVAISSALLAPSAGWASEAFLSQISTRAPIDSEAMLTGMNTLLNQVKATQTSAKQALATPLSLLASLSGSTIAGAATGANYSAVVQVGRNNNATILQEGAGNASVALQMGRGNTALVYQSSRAR